MNKMLYIPQGVTYWFYVALFCIFAMGCKIYSFKDVSIPKEVKTIRIGFIENHARFIDPTLAPQLTDKVKQKVNSQTRLTQVLNDPDYDVTCYISQYDISTAGVSSQQASTNRLTVSVHLAMKNRFNDQKLGTPDFETDLTRNFDFSATLSLTDAETQLSPMIISNMTDEIFNRLFSNW